jgi:hypothetical protein
VLLASDGVKHANGIYTSKETVNHGKTKIKEWAQRPDKRNNMAERFFQLLRPSCDADADATAWARGRTSIGRSVCSYQGPAMGVHAHAHQRPCQWVLGGHGYNIFVHGWA